MFPLTGLLFGVLIYYLPHLLPFVTHPEPNPNSIWVAIGLGFFCGTVFGVGLGYLVRTTEVVIPVDPSVDMYTRLQLLLADMGYRLGDRFQKVVIFEPSFRAGIFADRVRLEMQQGQIKLEGPVYHLEHICSKLGV